MTAPQNDLLARCAKLLHDGKIAEALRLYRERTGASSQRALAALQRLGK